MTDSMTNIENLGKPTPQQVAERSIKLLGVKKPPEPGQAVEPIVPLVKTGDPTSLVTEAYDLFAERIDLNDEIVRQERALMEPMTDEIPATERWSHYTGALQTVEANLEAQGQLSLDEKRALVRGGRINLLVATAQPGEVPVETIKKSQAKVREIEDRLDEVFADPQVYERFQQDLTRQVELRRIAREAISLDKFAEQADLLALRLARQAQVAGRPLTSVEKQIIEDNQALASEVEERRRDITSDPEIFDETRLLQLLEYRRELHKTGGKFVETPTRREYIETLERLWADGQKVLATGATGTGKTELVRFARSQMFGAEYKGDKYELTGHKDMTPYELLGRTGFNMKAGEGGDVYRPSKLIQAMTAKDRDGNLTGAPFLYDEMDASPNEANIALKTILNDGPGDGISVQMDSSEKFVIGPNYSFTGTANVKSEKHTTRFEIDPAIVRVLEPLVINYLPPWEVWDVVVASQMDRRGKINFSEEDAAVTLKALCDAAYWTQQAYRGEKVATGRSTFLEARGGASTGKPAALREGVLDPGRVVRMLRGWEAARVEGRDLRDFLNEQIVRFVNNENYPEEDRYYLTEIFALQGFLKGVQVDKLLVPGLTQTVLDRWTGGKSAKRARAKVGSTSLSAGDVAKLDPYKRLMRPAVEEAKEALELTEEAVSTTTATAESVDIERARDILGHDFLGPDEIEKAFNTTIDRSAIPDIDLTDEELEELKRQGGYLILGVEKTEDGKPLTMQTMAAMLQDEFTRTNNGKILYNTDWYKDEDFYKKDTPRLKWRQVTKEVIPNSTSKNYLQQTEVIANYVRDTVFAGSVLPTEWQDAIDEFEREKDSIAPIISSQWEVAARRLANLKINQMSRQTPTEDIYDYLVYFKNNNERLMEGMYSWSNRQASGGLLVLVGGFGTDGAYVNGWDPGDAGDSIGVCLSR